MSLGVIFDRLIFWAFRLCKLATAPSGTSSVNTDALNVNSFEPGPRNLFHRCYNVCQTDFLTAIVAILLMQCLIAASLYEIKSKRLESSAYHAAWAIHVRTVIRTRSALCTVNWQFTRSQFANFCRILRHFLGLKGVQSLPGAVVQTNRREACPFEIKRMSSDCSLGSPGALKFLRMLRSNLCLFTKFYRMPEDHREQHHRHGPF